MRWWLIYHNPIFCKIFNHKFETYAEGYDHKYCVRCGLTSELTETKPTINCPNDELRCYFCNACPKRSTLKKQIIVDYNKKENESAVCINCQRYFYKIDKEEWESTDFNYEPLAQQYFSKVEKHD